MSYINLCINIAILIQFFNLTNCQFNQCLRPAGCYLDECCFNIVPKTGEVCSFIPGCNKVFKNDCCRNARAVYTPYGMMYGYAILLDDEYSYRDDGKRYLQIWTGIPYAKPPTREDHRRFFRPEKPELDSSLKYDATYYRPACPQQEKYLKGLLNKTRSENCLFLNIFVVNMTVGVGSNMQRYPILVFFHGGEHSYGSAARYPGHVLAQMNIMVVTVQYRLNAFGFLSTNSKEAPGNYGLWDQLMALEYLRRNAESFSGNVNKVTLMGHGTGAADVALHMLSKRSGLNMPSPFFHQALLISGSDLMDGGFVKTKDESLFYANELAFTASCSKTDARVLVDCLSRRDAAELAESAGVTRIHRKDFLGRPWSPNIDGEFITDFPLQLRQKGAFARFPVIGGITFNDGSDKVLQFFPNATLGRMTPAEMREQLIKFAGRDFAEDPGSVADSVEFEYTYWPDPENDTMRLQMFTDIFTDRYYGAGLNYALKFQSDVKPQRNITQQYVFKYRSRSNPKSKYLGAYHGSDLEYIFGFPYFNATNWAALGLEDPGFYYESLDRNVTDYMLSLVSNFVLSGNATPEIIRNLTWDTFRPENRTYLLIDLEENFQYGFDLKQDFRVYHYAFWLHFYAHLLDRLPRFTTVLPTPAYLNEYKTSSFSLAAIVGLFFILLIGLAIVYARRRKKLVR